MDIENKVARTVHKYGRFLSLGLTLSLGYAATQTLGFASTTTIPYVGGAADIAGVGIFLVAAFSGFLSIASISEKSLVGVTALEFLKGFKKQVGEKIYEHYNPNKVHSSTEVHEKELFASFFKTLGMATLLDIKTSKTLPNKVEQLTSEQLNSEALKKAYLEQCVEKNVNILGKLFIFALTNNEENKGKRLGEIKKSTLATTLFKDLLSLNHELNKAEQKYIKTELSKLKTDSVKNPELIEFMQQRDNFSLLNNDNKELFLKIAGNKLENRDELVELYNQTDARKDKQYKKVTEEEAIQNLEQKTTVINELSYQTFSKFKTNVLSLYKNRDSELINLTLNQIESILLVKEQLEQVLPFTAEKEMMDLKMFLSQDVDKVITSFNREINILHKMKIMNHPELEEKKTLILDGINERMGLITNKMKDYQKLMHDSLNDELDSEYQVNKKVLSAKM
jgi:hypothetical protein